jgi:glutamine cyclotransferase
MRLATKIVSLALLSFPISSMASVPQCSSAALFVATLAETYPHDKRKRTDGFEKIIQSALDQTNSKVPTREQFNTAYIVMENLVKTWTGGPVQLKEQIIADAAAICMVTSTKK